MKMTMKATLVALALGASAFIVSAQDDNGMPPNNGGSDGPRGPGMRDHRPPPPAIIGALDANHDGVIDSNEIANASAALKSLDKNGDGKLTPDEFMGPRHHMRPGRENNSSSDNAKSPPDDNDGPPGPPPGDK
jgi:EF hand